ncbi:hypothetical protein DY000_02002645 [Brassica cretica]|uniref:Uncharacterized protein n=1 Tax=Brassica cretica TaxID=69181 RepID=A0ABQ7CJ78_BRACR|nr:hypothetical protein DY000_02002645 [Brassica cretica]
MNSASDLDPGQLVFQTTSVPFASEPLAIRQQQLPFNDQPLAISASICSRPARVQDSSRPVPFQLEVHSLVVRFHQSTKLKLSLATSADDDVDDTKGNSHRGDRRKRVVKGIINVEEFGEGASSR